MIVMMFLNNTFSYRLFYLLKCVICQPSVF